MALGWYMIQVPQATWSKAKVNSVLINKTWVWKEAYKIWLALVTMQSQAKFLWQSGLSLAAVQTFFGKLVNNLKQTNNKG